jgi:hypothetical protein
LDFHVDPLSQHQTTVAGYCDRINQYKTDERTFNYQRRRHVPIECANVDKHAADKKWNSLNNLDRRRNEQQLRDHPRSFVRWPQSVVFCVLLHLDDIKHRELPPPTLLLNER